MARQASFDRAEVLDKALNLFWRKGYQATSLKDLESVLDMRPGSIYAAFGSKESLFEEALALYSAKSRAAFEATMADAPTPLTGLANHVRNLGNVKPGAVPSRACLLVKAVLETPDDDPGLRRKAEAMMRDVEAAFAAAFSAAQEAGEIPPNLDTERLGSRLQSEIFGLRAYAQRTDVSGRVGLLAEDIARDIEALADLDHKRVSNR